MNAGLRYEVWTQPVERTDRQANFYLADLKLAFANNNVPTGVPAGYVENVPAGVGSRSLMKTSYTNFAPRLGFAFQAAPSLVLRGGAGVFYADDPFIGASGRLPANPPYAISNSYPTDNISPILYLSSGFPAGAVTDLNFNTVNMNVFSPDLQNGTVYHWSIGLQKQMGQYVFEGDYLADARNRVAPGLQHQPGLFRAGLGGFASAVPGIQ